MDGSSSGKDGMKQWQDDIKERLRDCPSMAHCRDREARIEEIEAHLAEADATIDAFGKVSPEQYRKEIDALKAQLAAARDALKPFAEIACRFDAHEYNDPLRPLLHKDEDHPCAGLGPTIGHLRNAAAALKDAKP